MDIKIQQPFIFKKNILMGDDLIVWGTTNRHFSQNAEHILDEVGLGGENRTLVTVKQVHSNHTVVVREDACREKICKHLTWYEPADALGTDSTNHVLAIKTADCLPIFLSARFASRTYVGVVHAGWAGTKKEIVHSWFKEIRECMGTREIERNAYLGPCIRACCYEVGKEFEEYFDKSFLETRGNKIYMNLVKANINQLMAEGFKEDQIDDIGICTTCHEDECFSYRRDGNKSGRMFSWIMKTQL